MLFRSGQEEAKLRLDLEDLPRPLLATHPEGVRLPCSRRRAGTVLFVPGYSAYIWDISDCSGGEEFL